MLQRTAHTIACVAILFALAFPAGVLAQNQDVPVREKEARITVHVDNGNFLDMRVYAVRNGNIYDRIGTVRSFTSREFELPSWVAASNSQVQLVVVPIGSRERYAAPPIMVSAGDVIEWKLMGNLKLSSIYVRSG